MEKDSKKTCWMKGITSAGGNRLGRSGRRGRKNARAKFQDVIPPRQEHVKAFQMPQLR